MKWLLKAFGKVGGFFKAKIKIIGITALAILISGVFVYVRGAEKAKGRLILTEQQNAQLSYTLDQNKTALEQCLAANTANAFAYEKQKARAIEAEKRLAVAETNQAHTEETIEHEAESFNTGADCPVYTVEFRRWLFDRAPDYH